MKLSTCAFLAASQILFSSHLFAEKSSDTIVVTGARYAQPITEALAPVSVITRDDIETKQLKSLDEALMSVPGVTIGRNGGVAGLSSAFLRGGESDHVVVLINGVKVGAASSGLFNFSTINIANVERIEVLRGASSSLYGSEAMSGVINIITRGRGGNDHIQVRAGGGTYDTKDVGFSISQSADNAQFSLGANWFETEGFDSCKPNGGCWNDEPDDDGHKDLSITGDFTYFGPMNSELNFSAIYTSGTTEYDSDFGNESETSKKVTQISYSIKPLNSLTLEFQTALSQDETESTANGSFYSDFNTDRSTASVIGHYQPTSSSTISLGFDYLNDVLDSSVDFAETSRENKAVFAQTIFKIGDDWSVQLSGRSDSNEFFDSEQTGTARIGWDYSDANRLTLSVSSAFKMPSFNEQYYPSFGGGYSSLRLQPEYTDSIDLGWDYATASVRTSINIFRTVSDDLIAYVFANNRSENIDKSRNTGLEIFAATEFEDINLSGQVTFLKTENLSEESTGNRNNELARRAKRTANIDISRYFGKLLLGTNVQYVSKRYNDVGNNTLVDSYTVADLRAEQRLNDDWHLQLKVENLFDRSYESVAGYNESERAFLVTLRYDH